MPSDQTWTENVRLSSSTTRLQCSCEVIIGMTKMNVYIRVSQPSSISSFSSSSSSEGRLLSGCAVVVAFGFLVALGAFGFLVGFGALGFLVGFGGFGFLVGFGAFCFFAFASFSAAFFALASDR